MKTKKKITPAQRRAAGLPQKLSLEPQHITKESWYYEERKGLHLVHWHSLPNGVREAIHVTIRWKSIQASMKRYAAYKRATRDSSGEHTK